jgi:hypothetical protein
MSWKAGHTCTVSQSDHVAFTVADVTVWSCWQATTVEESMKNRFVLPPQPVST